MVCEVIWAGVVAPRGVEVAMCYEEMDIVTTEKTYKKSANKRQSSKANTMGRVMTFQKLNIQASGLRIMQKIRGPMKWVYSLT